MDLGGFSMFDLFQTEVRQHAATLVDGLVALEQSAGDPKQVEPLMRAAHSIKGAARIISLDAAVELAHAMEECLVRIQRGGETPTPARIDQLLRGTDTLAALAGHGSEEAARGWCETERAAIAALAALFTRPAVSEPAKAPVAPAAPATVAAAVTPATAPSPAIEPTVTPPQPAIASPVPPATPSPTRNSEPGVLVSAANLETILELSGEALVEARRLHSLRRTLTRAKGAQRRLADALELIEQGQAGTHDHKGAAAMTGQALDEALEQVEEHLRRGESLASALHGEAVASRMRPFGDACGSLPRAVRDLARNLAKEVRLVVAGEQVPVDREVLRQLEAPLGHLVRNAIDHGIESPEQRAAAGKPRQATLRVEARHHAGGLVVEVAEDGRGIDRAKLRERIVAKGLATESLAASLADAELFDFLFLPGFSTAEKVTDISGRGVGLDVVQSMAHAVGGSIVVKSSAKGTTFSLRLPVTLSVVRAAVVAIAGEPYALPLAKLERIDRLPREAVTLVEGRPSAVIRGESVGLVRMADVLELTSPQETLRGDTVPTVSVLAGTRTVGFVVDAFLGEEDLVVRRLDARLGSVPHIDAASLRESGELLLILDTDDLIQSALQLLDEGGLRGAEARAGAQASKKHRVLIVEDSITVREVERQMLVRAGYAVDTAVDGIDGWNALQKGTYDLIVSDVDMPRMNGIELVRRVRGDGRFNSIPIVIVSYKDREEDRLAGMEAGASAYLTKGSFQDRTFLDTVASLLGVAH